MSIALKNLTSLTNEYLYFMYPSSRVSTSTSIAQQFPALEIDSDIQYLSKMSNLAIGVQIESPLQS